MNFLQRKLIALVLAAGLLIFNLIDQETFKIIAIAFMGANAVEHVGKNLNKGEKK